MSDDEERVEGGGRLETGVVQEPGDWPGVFIRGDDAFALSCQVYQALERLGPELETDTFILRIMRNNLKGLAELLESCDMRKKPRSQMVRRVSS